MSAGDNRPEFRRPAWVFIMLGFAVAPLAPELPLVAIIAFADGAPFKDFISAGSFAVVTVGHILSLALGVPTFVTLQLLGKRGLGHYITGGTLAGIAVPAVVFMLSSRGGPPPGAVMVITVIGAGCGALVAGVFWWIVFGGSRHRRAEAIVDVFD